MTEIDVLIAGAGLAGSRCAETLRAGGFGGRVVVAGDEPHAPYERPALSKEMLTGARAPGDLALRDVGFWKDRGIELRLGEGLGDVDLRARRALLGGEPVRWRHLVVATGARARRLGSVPAAGNVHHLRGLDDAQALRADLERGGRLVIIGCGFVGAEVASSAMALGVEVSLVEALPLPFAATLGPAVGRRLADHYRAEGVDLRLGVGVTGVAVRAGRVESVELADGTRLPCAALLVAVGTRPSAEILHRLLPLADDGGVPTDAEGATDAPGVHACGDVASPWRPELGDTSGWSTGPPPRRAARPSPARSWVRHPRPPRRRTSGRTSSGGGSRWSATGRRARTPSWRSARAASSPGTGTRPERSRPPSP